MGHYQGWCEFWVLQPSIFFSSGVLNPTGLGQKNVDCRPGSTYRIEGSRTRGYESTKVSDEQVFRILLRQRKKGVSARGGWSQKK